VSRNRIGATVAIACAALAAAPVAVAAGGGGGSGGGGGGGTTTCRPLVTQVAVGHADSGQSGIGVGATVSDCTSLSQQHIHLNVSVPGSTTVPYNTNLALNPGTVLTMNASPIGSTPGQLQYSKTYTVIATLTDTSTAPATVLATTTSSVTMPAGPVR
jgi:hypothetical protein